MSNSHVLISDGTTWPSAGKETRDLNWRLRYGDPNRQDMLQAASVLSAYLALVEAPEKKRRVVVRDLRRAARKEDLTNEVF